MLLLVTLNLNASSSEDVQIDGLTYTIWHFSSGEYAQISAPENGDYSGDIIIPEEINHNGITYPVKSIGGYAFCYDPVTSVTIPNSITEIRINAFLDCRKLKTLTIPESVETLGRDVFGGCTLNPLIIKTTKVADYKDVFERMKKESVIYAHASEVSKIKRYFDNVYDMDTPYTIEIIETYLRGVKFRLVPNEYCSGEYKFSRVEVNGNKVEPLDDGTYFFKGSLNSGNWNTIKLYAQNNKGEEMISEKSFTGETYKIKIYTSEITQTTASFRVTASFDETAKPISATVQLAESTYYNLSASSSEFIEDQTIVKFTNLTPNTPYSKNTYYHPQATVTYIDGEQFSNTAYDGFKTKNIGIKYENEIVGPTNYSINYALTSLGDCQLKDIDIFIYESKYSTPAVAPIIKCEPDENNRISFTGQNPSSSFYLIIDGKTDKDKSFNIDKKSIYFSALELETLKPRVVSSTNAIVAASTNISDVETKVGFQWKKYDAPASLAPNEGYAAIYDGQLEGYIKNLQPTSYYNVRAFYKSANEKYYYSDWVTFDPSDFSYFEPTVHTYPVEPSTDGSVNVKGYVLAGTDDITEQGFEYWSVAGGAKAKRMLAEAPAGSVSKIFATGQVMTATLTDLAPSTTYTLRAFVTTVAGVTYGEEQTFTTPADAAGIIGIDPDMSEPEVTGYYDLNGRRHEEPFSGLNIIRYSDGSARKVFFK